MLFRVIKADPECKDDTLLGFQWIEVLAVQPQGVQRVEREDGTERWVYDNAYICRTEHGIMVLCENDLMPEIDDGIYVEAPECPHCAMVNLLERMPVMVFDEDQKSLKAVVSACQNGDAIQLNVEHWEENDDEKSC